MSSLSEKLLRYRWFNCKTFQQSFVTWNSATSKNQHLLEPNDQFRFFTDTTALLISIANSTRISWICQTVCFLYRIDGSILVHSGLEGLFDQQRKGPRAAFKGHLFDKKGLTAANSRRFFLSFCVILRKCHSFTRRYGGDMIKVSPSNLSLELCQYFRRFGNKYQRHAY